MYGIMINRNLNLSLTRQICDQLRKLIQESKIGAGSKLPSTRKMAGELKISRNTGIDVYEQLTAEGYLESRVGSGTYVKGGILQNQKPENKGKIFLKTTGIKNKIKDEIIDFTAGLPDLKLFPRKQWEWALKISADYLPNHLLGYNNIMGNFNFRKTIAEYIFRVKGIKCNPLQIIIVSGASEGYLLIAKFFSKMYNSIYVEDPTVKFIRNIFNGFNYRIKPVPVDQKGLKIQQFTENKKDKLLLVTPSHQFPTGSILTIQRRQQLIEIFSTTSSYLIEDDYDSEFRLKGVPVPPMQTLDPSRVIYINTFSKNMFPALRLGFLIIPPELLDEFYKVKSQLNIRTSIIKQEAMNNFIKEGHLDRHIYKMRKVYKKRRSLLISLLKDNFKNEIAIHGDETGMHIQVEFLSNRLININWKKAVEYGVSIHSFDEYRLLKKGNSNKIVLGYGNLDSNKIKTGVQRLAIFING